MKINSLSFYKTPLDNTYKNIIDYEDIDNFFMMWDSFTEYPENKSVSINKKITISLVLTPRAENPRNFNYLIINKESDNPIYYFINSITYNDTLSQYTYYLEYDEILNNKFSIFNRTLFLEEGHFSNLRLSDDKFYKDKRITKHDPFIYNKEWIDIGERVVFLRVFYKLASSGGSNSFNKLSTGILTALIPYCVINKEGGVVLGKKTYNYITSISSISSIYFAKYINNIDFTAICPLNDIVNIDLIALKSAYNMYDLTDTVTFDVTKASTDYYIGLTDTAPNYVFIKAFNLIDYNEEVNISFYTDIKRYNLSNISLEDFTIADTLINSPLSTMDLQYITMYLSGQQENIYQSEYTDSILLKLRVHDRIMPSLFKYRIYGEEQFPLGNEKIYPTMSQMPYSFDNTDEYLRANIYSFLISNIASFATTGLPNLSGLNGLYVTDYNRPFSENLSTSYYGSDNCHLLQNFKFLKNKVDFDNETNEKIILNAYQNGCDFNEKTFFTKTYSTFHWVKARDINLYDIYDNEAKTKITEIFSKGSMVWSYVNFNNGFYMDKLRTFNTYILPNVYNELRSDI